jgi:hypothetical protein
VKEALFMHSPTILGAIVLAATIVLANSAHAMTARECRSQYKAAKTDGSLHGMKWREYRTSECGLVSRAAPARRRMTTGEHTMPGERPANSKSSWGAPDPGGNPQ